MISRNNDQAGLVNPTPLRLIYPTPLRSRSKYVSLADPGLVILYSIWRTLSHFGSLAMRSFSRGFVFCGRAQEGQSTQISVQFKTSSDAGKTAHLLRSNLQPSNDSKDLRREKSKDVKEKSKRVGGPGSRSNAILLRVRCRSSENRSKNMGCPHVSNHREHSTDTRTYRYFGRACGTWSLHD